MTQIAHWGIDPFDIVWKSFLDANSTFNTMQENNLDRVSLVKMDIEGAEYEIIEHLEDEVFEKMSQRLWLLGKYHKM